MCFRSTICCVIYDICLIAHGMFALMYTTLTLSRVVTAGHCGGVFWFGVFDYVICVLVCLNLCLL